MAIFVEEANAMVMKSYVIDDDYVINISQKGNFFLGRPVLWCSFATTKQQWTGERCLEVCFMFHCLVNDDHDENEGENDQKDDEEDDKDDEYEDRK